MSEHNLPPKESLNGQSKDNTKPIKLQYDTEIDIAEGPSCKEKRFPNTTILFSKFGEKLAIPHVSDMTWNEYKNSSKAKQDEDKDVGVNLTGHLIKGNRKNVAFRQVAAFDSDSSEGSLIEDIKMFFPNAAFFHTTRKHTQQNQRWRIYILLSRPVNAVEYEAVSRYIAGHVGIENFDDTTFQFNRLMFWPSICKDGEFKFEYLDGPPFDVDEALRSYKDYKDVRQWPASKKAGETIARSIKKQGDPLEKTGVVGAFCRTYDIHEAIDLTKAYEVCDVDDRYTFSEGSTAAGLVTYEDKYAFSHHGTDPASGKLCNAFDLVRIHKFGSLDEDVKEGTPGNKLPSYNAMLDFATKDPKVIKQLGVDKLQESKADFSEIIEEEEAEEINTDWLELMDVDRKGNYRNTVNNYRIILRYDPLLKALIVRNIFENRDILTRDSPWRKVTSENKYFTDADFGGLVDYIEKTYEIKSKSDLEYALSLCLIENSIHPIREYLNSLRWDNEERIDSLLIDYLGAKDCEYVRAVTRKMLVALVARIFTPGCKFDYVVVLIGRQALGKSTFLRKLGKVWFSDSLHTVQGKEALEAIQGVWLIEMAELAGLKKAEIEVIKHFIAKQEDRYRVAYGHRTESFARQCVFVATTNTRDFLQDPTGNRRFWPVDLGDLKSIKNIWKDLDEYQIDQIWAEAVRSFRAGETLYLTSELEAEANKVQSDHREVDDRTGIIQDYLDTMLPIDWDSMDYFQRRSFLTGDELQEKGTIQRSLVCVAEIWCELFGKQKSDMNRFNTKDLHNIMRTMPGWDEGGKTVIAPYGKQRYYIRSDENTKKTGKEHKKFSVPINSVLRAN